MINPLGSIIRALLPVALVFLAFNYLGAAGGALVILAIILAAVYFNRSIIYQNKAGKKYYNGDFEGALNDLKKAVSFDPKSARTRGSYALLLLKLGNVREASCQIDEAINKAKLEIDKNNLTITKAMVMWKQGRIEEAVEMLEELLKVFENTNVYAALGLLYIEKGDYSKALEFNLEARDFNAGSPVIMDNLATSYLMLGDYDKAFEVYQEVMKLRADFPEAYYSYAKVLEHKGNIEKAAYMVRHALTLRFWHTSAISRDEAEAYLGELEAKAALH